MTEEQKLVELNLSLEILATFFPNIQYEVFREMLTAFHYGAASETEREVRQWALANTEPGAR